MGRILFLVSSMEGGGAERVAALLCNYWAEKGHHVTLMPTFSGRGTCLYPLDDKVRLDYLADRVGNSNKSLLNTLYRLFALRKAIKEIEPDCIVSFLPHVNIAALLASARLGVPVIAGERTYPPAVSQSWAIDKLRKWTYPMADRVVMQTESGRKWLEECVPRARCHVIANPVIFPLPPAEPAVSPVSIIKSSRRLLLSVGRLSTEKDFITLLDAFSDLAKNYPDWDLVILGEGEERVAIETRRQMLGLIERVHLPGRIGNLEDWYRRADIFVLSSRFEGFPNALLEAMAYGLPAVSFDCDTGPKDIIRHERDGLLVEPRSGAIGLRHALTKLIKNAAARELMGKAAMDVRGRFAMDRIARKWDEILGLEG